MRAEQRFAAMVLGAIVASGGGEVRAAVFTVDDTADAVDTSPGDGVCASAAPGGKCTLRAAVQEANVLPGRDTILLPGQTIVLTIAGTEEDVAAQGDLDILGDLDIKGQGTSATIIDGGALDRVFDCDPDGTVQPMRVRMAGLTIRNGKSWGGGAIRFASALQLASVVLDDNRGDLSGGALLADAYWPGSAPALELVRSKVQNNSTQGDGGGVNGSEAVALLVRQSQFTGNLSTFGDGGGIALSTAGGTVLDSFFHENTAFLGGAVSSIGASAQDIQRSTFHFNFAFQGAGAHLGVASIANVTFWENTAESGGGLAQGGSSGPIVLNNVTFKGNWALNNPNSPGSPFGSAIAASMGSMSNTVLDDNVSLDGTPSCSTTVLTSLGYNVADDATCQLNAPHDLPVTSTPLVADLPAMNDGIMLTNTPEAGSPVIEGGNPGAPGSGNNTCEPDDQRQIGRPAVASLNVSPAVCDIGALEVCKAPSNAPDHDADGIPDVCDGDWDGDGCLDRYDQHPHSAVVPGGPVLNVCGGNSTWSYFEGDDDDGDGLPNCEDDDDDDDAVTDDVDPCPQNPGTVLCAHLGSNPCPPKWFTCAGGGCNELILKFLYLVDPERSVILEHASIVNDRFYAAPASGKTAAASIQALSGGVAGKGATKLAAVAAGEGPIWRLEVWTRGTVRGDAGKLLGVVGELRARDIVVDALATGNVVSIQPPFRSGALLRLATAWTVGSTGSRLPDADGDGRPDAYDNCVFTPNAPQADANRNGMGDACELPTTKDRRLSLFARVIERAKAIRQSKGVVLPQR